MHAVTSDYKKDRTEWIAPQKSEFSHGKLSCLVAKWTTDPEVPGSSPTIATGILFT